MDSNFVSSMIRQQIVDGQYESDVKKAKEENERRKAVYQESFKDFDYLKELLVRQIKMIYALQTTLGVYTAGFQDTYKKIIDKGVDTKKLGDLGKAIRYINESNDSFNKMTKALMKVWEYTSNRQEINEFTTHTYQTFQEILENASRCAVDGSYKKDFNYVALIPQEDIKALDEWYGTIIKNKKKDEKIIEVI